MDTNEFIQRWQAAMPARDVEAVVDFVSTASDGKRFLVGKNSESEHLASNIKVEAVVDDFSDSGGFWKGLPLIKSADLPSSCFVLNCSTSISPISVDQKMKELIGDRVIPYSDLYRAGVEVPLPSFVKEMREEIEIHGAMFDAIHSTLDDSVSRKVWSDVIFYRMTGDYRFMSDYQVNIENQYFEDFFKWQPGEVFVDAGGFDGDTTELFFSYCPAGSTVFFFEPSPDNMAKAKIRLRDFVGVNYILKGVSDHCGKLNFDPTLGSASAIQKPTSNDDVHEIDITTIDFEVEDNVTFIKMDLEGHELMALNGAKRKIKEDHPKLAIAIYHSAADLWRLHRFIMSVRSDYKVYVRHYTEGWSETIMFFVPIPFDGSSS